MLEIRKAYSTEAYNIVNLTLEVWKDEYSDLLPVNIINDMSKNIDGNVRHLRDQIEENNRILVAVIDDKIVGYVFYAKGSSQVYEHAGEIRSIYILKEYQRQGIGRKLFDSSIIELKKLGFNSMIVNCPVKNRNNEFFIKMGGMFKEIISSKVSEKLIDYNVIYFDLTVNNNDDNSEWQELYTKLVDVSLSITVNRGTIALITSSDNIYFGLNVLGMVSAMEVCVSNMRMGGDDKVDKIIIMNTNNELVIPNGRDLELLMESGNGDAQVLIDISTMEVKMVSELISDYKMEV